MKKKARPTRLAFIAEAKKRVDDIDVVVYDQAEVTFVDPIVESGAWVQCWMFIRDDEIEKTEGE